MCTRKREHSLQAVVVHGNGRTNIFSVPLFPFRATTRQNQHFCLLPFSDTTRLNQHFCLLPCNVNIRPNQHFCLLPFHATTRLNQHFCLLPFNAATRPNQHFYFRFVPAQKQNEFLSLYNVVHSVALEDSAQTPGDPLSVPQQHRYKLEAYIHFCV